MPKRGSVKIKRVMPKGAAAEDANILNDMFSQMTGADHSDPDVIIPKMIRLNELLLKYAKVYNLLITFKDFVDNFSEHKQEFLDIASFIEKIGNITTESNKFTEVILKTWDIAQINGLYKKMKSMKEVQDIIITSSNLGKHNKYLTDKDKLGDEFIKREPGLNFKPLVFTNLDLKLLWVSDKLTTTAKNFILNILSHTYTIGHEIYKIVTSPDIDIKKFGALLLSNIDNMKKQIPRCDKAFDVIAKSINLLEDKFETYYKTSIETENPSIIIESFIVDVSMTQKTNATVTTQFRKIIMFMKKQSANNKDPRVSKLFKILNNQFNMMERETGVDPDEPEAEPDAAEPDAAEPGAPEPEAEPDAAETDDDQSDDSAPPLVPGTDEVETESGAKDSDYESDYEQESSDADLD